MASTRVTAANRETGGRRLIVSAGLARLLLGTALGLVALPAAAQIVSAPQYGTAPQPSPATQNHTPPGDHGGKSLPQPQPKDVPGATPEVAPDASADSEDDSADAPMAEAPRTVATNSPPIPSMRTAAATSTWSNGTIWTRKRRLRPAARRSRVRPTFTGSNITGPRL